jgi:hypothetical protein
MVLGAGLEPACLSAYAPQTYVSAIPPPELLSWRASKNFPQTPATGKSPLPFSTPALSLSLSPFLLEIATKADHAHDHRSEIITIYD